MPLKSPKNKGSQGEREAAALLATWGDEVGIEIDPTRNLEQTRGGGYDLNGVYGLGIEVKRVEAPALNSWWKQTVRQANADGTTPFLMHRANRKPWSFRVRVWVAVFSPDQKGATAALDVDLTLAEAKKWFQLYLQMNLEQVNASMRV